MEAKTEVNKEEFIQELLQGVPEDKKAMLGYAYRHLPHHLRESGKSEEEVTKLLDKAKFPQELR